LSESKPAEDALRAELPYSHAFIGVSLADGHVTLRGEVEWLYQKERAEAAVRALPALSGVRNLICARPQVDAAEIRRRIKEDRRQRPGSVRAWAEPRGA
jgi:osmotically-inducible protein OsmY